MGICLEFRYQDFKNWRGGRGVEWDGLENRCGGNSTQGSNPCLSAMHIPYSDDYIGWSRSPRRVRLWRKNRCGGNSTQGSNPCLSALHIPYSDDYIGWSRSPRRVRLGRKKRCGGNSTQGSTPRL